MSLNQKRNSTFNLNVTNMNSVFITRKITIDSPFYQLLKKKGFDINGDSFIEFQVVNISVLPMSDWIFFYSKNGIRFFFEQVKRLGLKKENLNYKWAAIGQASATHLKQFGIKADFIGSGEPSSTAFAFLEVAKNQSVLFPRAANSKKSIQNILGNQIKPIDLIIYNNSISNNVKKRNEDCLVFTSPLNTQAYFQYFQLQPFQKIIAIGKTTAKTLTALGISEFVIAEAPNETSLANAVINFTKV